MELKGAGSSIAKSTHHLSLRPRRPRRSLLLLICKSFSMSKPHSSSLRRRTRARVNEPHGRHLVQGTQGSPPRALAAPQPRHLELAPRRRSCTADGPTSQRAPAVSTSFRLHDLLDSERAHPLSPALAGPQEMACLHRYSSQLSRNVALPGPTALLRQRLRVLQKWLACIDTARKVPETSPCRVPRPFFASAFTST